MVANLVQLLPALAAGEEAAAAAEVRPPSAANLFIKISEPARLLVPAARFHQVQQDLRHLSAQAAMPPSRRIRVPNALHPTDSLSQSLRRPHLPDLAPSAVHKNPALIAPACLQHHTLLSLICPPSYLAE